MIRIILIVENESIEDIGLKYEDTDFRKYDSNLIENLCKALKSEKYWPIIEQI